MAERPDRIAVVDRELCRPDKCQDLCRKVCPIVRSGDDCITYENDEQNKRKVKIDEGLCVGCGICVKRCPYHALSVVNLPSQLKETPIHRFGENDFVLFRLPIPSTKDVVGIVGPNGVGKSTALRILSGEMTPNLGVVSDEAESGRAGFDGAVDMFRGTQLQEYFQNLKESEIRTSIKPQRVDQIPMVFKGKASDLLSKTDERGIMNDMAKEFMVESIMERKVSELSGGELQRIAIIAALSKDADIYYLDEPTSFLDVFHRLKIAKLIRKHCEGKSVMIVDHDLATLDFLADRVHIFYGVPAVYGIVSKPYGVRVGINTFLDGYVKEDNVRFREESINLLDTTMSSKSVDLEVLVSFSNLKKAYGKDGFRLRVAYGDVRVKEALAVLGANALGKTTLAKLLAGELRPDEGQISSEVKISYKPQYIKSDFSGTVSELISKTRAITTEYRNTVIRPLGLENLLEKFVEDLSGGELQRVAVAICLGRDADLYLLDEPSAFLDVEQRLVLAKLVKRLTEINEKSALVIDHDLLFLSQIGSRGMVFLGESGVSGRVENVDTIKTSFNRFLSDVGITFRQDPQTGRPRANKPDSQLDREQKESGDYYFI
ncbi:MAG: ribosome biogenesis/translation initiation ATPase RLI [Kosmotogaceae bacterium]|nr:ribosome biogenesis/translation initiation ATPase RLI [Kosmotogaceae bacterium]